MKLVAVVTTSAGIAVLHESLLTAVQKLCVNVRAFAAAAHCRDGERGVRDGDCTARTDVICTTSLWVTPWVTPLT